jgi:hypothetical protein
MKLPERFDKEYRLLALAVVFFLAGGVFFWYDASLPSSSKSPSVMPGRLSRTVAVQPAGASPSGERPSNEQSGGAQQAGGQQDQQLDPAFANLPPPSQFATLDYDQKDINGTSTFVASTTCGDAYVAILIFPASVDYRADIDAAVYNEAFPCHLNQPFMTTIAPSDLAPSPSGTYYIIIADQGKSGTWYNPR